MKSRGESVGFSADGATLRCDGDGCTAIVPFPVGLAVGSNPDHAGWLFVSNAAGNQHFCPDCALTVLRTRDDKHG